MECNPRLLEFDKLFLATRLKEQRLMKVFGDKEQKAAIKKIKLHNKNMKIPPYADYFPYLDGLALALYIFLSREQVQSLNKLGPLS